MPWEAMLRLSTLETRSLNVAVCDTVTTIPKTNGIRQGSPDSTDLFGAIIARDLQKAITPYLSREGPERRAPTPPYRGILSR